MHPRYLPVSIRVRVNDTVDNLKRNILHAMSLGLPEFEPDQSGEGKTLLIAATGPSLSRTLPDLVENIGPLMCVNGAQNWLMDRGITPDWCVLVDSTPEFTRIVRPERVVKYLLASQCAPELFDHLSLCDVTLWHAGAKDEELGFKLTDIIDKDGARKWIIGGGGTAALRCLNLGYLMGYRRFRIYGLDSSFDPDGRHHCNDDPVPRSEVDVEYGGREFKTVLPLMHQASTFEQLYMRVFNDCRIDCIGDGLIPHICSTLNKLKYGEHDGRL